MKLVMVDTGILIEVLRGRDLTITRRWERTLSTAVIAYSPVTAAELWPGVLPTEDRTAGVLFYALTCLTIDAAIGRKAGEYLRSYGRSHGLELGDALIAATAATHRIPLWTLNRARFPMAGVRCY